MTNLPLLIGPYQIIAIVSVILLLFFTALFLIGKHEKGLIYFIWLIVLIFLPVIGPIAYLLKYFAGSNRMSSQTMDTTE
jgi:uncharacterized membrane protein